MEYTRITALVPDGEHFDASAMNEGIWLTVSHVNAIETSLEAAGGALATMTTERDNVQQQLAQSQTAAQTAATQAQSDLQARDAQIATLQTQVADLSKKPASEFLTTTRAEDPKTGNAGTPSYADDNNPLNRLADSMFGKPATK